MNVNEIIIKTLENAGVEYVHPHDIDYRFDSFEIDYYLPNTKTFIILEYDSYNHEIYKDISLLGLSSGFRTIIIPMHEINNEKELVNWIFKAVYPDLK